MAASSNESHAEWGGPADGQVGRVIVGIDDTQVGLAALREAVGLARASAVPVVAVRAWALGLPRHGGRRLRHLVHKHVVLYFSGQEQEDAAAALTRKALRMAVGTLPADLNLAIRTPGGDPAVALTEIATQAGDILVVGHEPAVSVRGIVHGSVAAYCRRHAQCPVIVVDAGQPSYWAGCAAA